MASVQGCVPRVVTEVPAGSTVSLDCHSNDYNHNFMFWQFGKDTIIGPGNPYDANKYKYEVLSGKLFIKGVSQSESGCYNCYSNNVEGFGHSVESVQMIVKDGGTHQSYIGSALSAILPAHNLKEHEMDVAMDAVKLVAIIVSFIVIIGCAIIYYRLRRDWSKYDGRMVVAADDEDDEEGDEIYNRTTTSLGQPTAGPSRNASSDQLYGGIDNQGLDTDFNSVFQQIQIKSPPTGSLI